MTWERMAFPGAFITNRSKWGSQPMVSNIRPTRVGQGERGCAYAEWETEDSLCFGVLFHGK